MALVGLQSRNPWEPRLPVVSSVGSFTPLALGNALYDMWDAEMASTITLSGSSVTEWRSVKNGYAAVQAVSGARPVYSATSFGGRPGVTFDGVDDELTYAGVGNFPTAAVPCEIWALVDQTALVADTTARYAFSYGGNTFTTQRGLRRGVTTGVNRAGLLFGTGAVTSTAMAPGDYSGRSGLRLEVMATEGYASLNGNRSTAAAGVPATGATLTRIGASTEGANFFQGRVSAIAVTALLTDAQAAQMSGWQNIRRGAF